MAVVLYAEPNVIEVWGPPRVNLDIVKRWFKV